MKSLETIKNHIINNSKISKIKFYEGSACVLWDGPGKREAMTFYARMKVNDKNVRVKRVAYELFYGIKLQKEIKLYSLCKTPLCFNPKHVKAVVNKNETHCKNGHKLTQINTYIEKTKYGSRRRCKICKTDANKKLRQSYKNKKKQKPSANELKTMLVEGWSNIAIARKCGYSDSAVIKWITKLQLKQKND